MPSAYQRLGDTLLERRAPSAGTLACKPRALRAWVDALPMANFSVAAKRLLDALDDLNARHFERARRLEALEVLRAAAMPLIAATDKQIVGASFPLPAPKAELGELALAFQHGLAAGYRAALWELCAPAGAVPFLRGKQVALAAVRALQHGGEHLARAYLLYRTPPAGAWQALHAVHRFAAALRLDTREVEDPLQPGGVDARTVYVQALLLALANPYRHTQREQGDAIALVHALAPHAQLRDRNGDVGDLLIDIDADRGPGYLPEERTSGQRDTCCLHLDGMLAFIDAQLAMVPSGARIALFRRRGAPVLHADIDLVRRLTAGWSTRGERGQPRLGGGYMLDSVLGLHDLHFVLTGGEDFDSFQQRVRGQAISLSEADRGASWRIGASAPGRAARLPARVLDQSLGGYRVLWERGPDGASARVRVAELVGLSLPEAADEAKPDWLIGVIRWIRIDEHGRVDAGIELLARRALPIGARINQRAAVRALLLAPLNTEHGSDYDALLVPSEIERDVQALELTLPADLQGPPMPARTVQANRLRLLEASGLYQHFAMPPHETADAVDTAAETDTPGA